MQTTAKEEMKSDHISGMNHTAQAAKDSLQNSASQAGRKVREMFNSASDEISQVGDHVTSEIRGNPIRSSVIALSIGVLLGALIRR